MSTTKPPSRPKCTPRTCWPAAVTARTARTTSRSLKLHAARANVISVTQHNPGATVSRRILRHKVRAVIRPPDNRAPQASFGEGNGSRHGFLEAASRSSARPAGPFARPEPSRDSARAMSSRRAPNCKAKLIAIAASRAATSVALPALCDEMKISPARPSEYSPTVADKPADCQVRRRMFPKRAGLAVADGRQFEGCQLHSSPAPSSPTRPISRALASALAIAAASRGDAGPRRQSLYRASACRPRCTKCAGRRCCGLGIG